MRFGTDTLRGLTEASCSSILRRKGGGKAVRVRLIGDELNLRCAGILVIYWSGILEKPQVAIDRKSQQCIDACKRATPCSKYVVGRSQGVSFRCQASRCKGLDLAARSGGT
jgi:hypothetical protein